MQCQTVVLLDTYSKAMVYCCVRSNFDLDLQTIFGILNTKEISFNKLGLNWDFEIDI